MQLIQEQVLLAPYTTFRVGGEADYFAEITTIEELHEAVAFAREKELPIFVLGGGSNIVLPDEGFRGLVLYMRIIGCRYMEPNNGVVEVSVGAGINWDSFVADTVGKKLYGIENLSLIPGTVGASVIQNIGAYGTEVKEVVKWVEALNSETGKMETLTPEECAFEYRDSVFKHDEGRNLIVTRVGFALKENGTLNTTYKDVTNYFDVSKEKPTLESVRNAIIEIRSKKLPDPKLVGTAGSFFKNPIVTKDHYEDLLSEYPELPGHNTSNNMVKIPLAWILDNVCNLKGYRVGALGTHATQPLAIVNYGGATRDDIFHFAKHIAQVVKEKTNITIEPEVLFIKNNF